MSTSILKNKEKVITSVFLGSSFSSIIDSADYEVKKYIKSNTTLSDEKQQELNSKVIPQAEQDFLTYSATVHITTQNQPTNDEEKKQAAQQAFVKKYTSKGAYVDHIKKQFKEENAELHLSSSQSMTLQQLMTEQNTASQAATSTLKSLKDILMATLRNI